MPAAKKQGLEAGLIVNEAPSATRDGRRSRRRAASPDAITAARKRLARSLAERLRNGVFGDTARITFCMLAVCGICPPSPPAYACSEGLAQTFSRVRVHRWA
jgi:hypothetical protein